MTPAPISPAALAARRFFRLAPVILWLLEEARSTPLDSAAYRRLASEIPLLARSLEQSLPEELQKELMALTPVFDGQDASKDEVRVALAQLGGWVEGTMNGLALMDAGRLKQE
jgi:hypothetical protein